MVKKKAQEGLSEDQIPKAKNIKKLKSKAKDSQIVRMITPIPNEPDAIDMRWVDPMVLMDKFNPLYEPKDTEQEKLAWEKDTRTRPLIVGKKCQLVGPYITEEGLKTLSYRQDHWYSQFVESLKNKAFVRELQKWFTKEGRSLEPIPENVDINDLPLDTKKKIYKFVADALLVQSEGTDPFSVDDQTPFSTRYFGAIVKKLYPPTYTEYQNELGEMKRDYINKFHPRGLYYRILSLRICLPIKFKIKDREPPYQFSWGFYKSEAYLNDEYVLFPAEAGDELWEYVVNELKAARFAGLVPMEQVIESRVTSKIEVSSSYPFVKNAQQQKYSGELDLSLTTTSDIFPEVEGPVIVLFSEKSELLWVFEYIAKKYHVAYYVGDGQISIVGAQMIYEFIKKHGKSGIILTCTDFDPSGVHISTALARKLQWFYEEDKNMKDKPSILFQQFLLSETEIRELYERDIAGIPRTYKVGKAKPVKEEIFELAILESLLGTKNYESVHNLGELVLVKLEKLFGNNRTTITENPDKSLTINKGSPLISVDAYNVLKDNQFRKLQEIMDKNIANLLKQDNPQINQIKTDLGITGITTWSNYIIKLKDFMVNLPSYKFIKDVANTSNIVVEDLKLDKSLMDVMGMIKSAEYIPPEIPSELKPNPIDLSEGFVPSSVALAQYRMKGDLDQFAKLTQKLKESAKLKEVK